MSQTELQRIVFPTSDSYGAEDSYLRKVGGYYCAERDGFRFFRGLEFNTLTFYNALSVAKWRKYTNIESLFLRLRGEGRIILRLMLAQPDNSNRGVNSLLGQVEILENHYVELQRIELALDPGEGTTIELGALSALADGLLYYDITPLDDGVLTGASYLTDDAPERDVRLALVITHFNRVEQVTAAVARIERDLLHDEAFAGKIALSVIDNSRNSGLESHPGVTIVPNENYGGAGGFSRGLLEAYDSGEFSHCLFMDDDASCEIESLRRAYRLMAFTTTERFAVAGALLHKDSPSRLYEKGAVFDGLCRKIHPDLNISLKTELAYAEEETNRPNYGGWWLFGFPLAEVRHFPFPFFVRGDDTSFGMVNDFTICTMNGIASYGESFEQKNGAMQTYLDTRGHLVKQLGLLGHGRLQVLKGLARFFLMSLVSFNYGSARAVLLAARDIREGPSFFVDNIDMRERLRVLSELGARERMTPVTGNYEGIDFVDIEDEAALRKLLRLATLNGVLVPGFLSHRNAVFQQKGFKATFKQIFRYSKIYYEHSPSMTGYTAEYDRRAFLDCSWQFLLESMRFFLGFNAISADYRSNMPGIMSPEFWREVYSNPAPTQQQEQNP